MITRHKMMRKKALTFLWNMLVRNPRPQLGQASALELTLRPQSGQLLSAMGAIIEHSQEPAIPK